MKKIYAEPMTKVMKLNVAPVMNPPIQPASVTTPDQPTDPVKPMDLF
jgi:hypothetical protein